MTPHIHPPTLDEGGPRTTLSEYLLTAHKQLSLVGLALFANLHALRHEAEFDETLLIDGTESALDVVERLARYLRDLPGELPLPLAEWYETQSQADLVRAVKTWAKEYPLDAPGAAHEEGGTR